MKSVRFVAVTSVVGAALACCAEQADPIDTAKLKADFEKSEAVSRSGTIRLRA